MTLTPDPLASPIRVEFIGGRWVRLLEPITWRGPYPSTIAAGFRSDGGSVPSVLWALVGHPLSAGVLACYLLHDADLMARLPWREATRRLDARLRAVGCATVRRWLIVAGVAAYGWIRRAA